MIATPTRPSSLIPAEQVQDAKRANIRGYLPGLKPWSRTDGGEFHGPCPRCGGKDRLIFWPRHPKGPRIQCRQCHPESMNPVDLVIWLDKAPDFRGAVLHLTGGRLPMAAPLPPVDTTPQPYEPPRPPRYEVAYYDYRDFDGALLWQKVRIEPGYRGARKTFRLRYARPTVARPRNDHPEDWYKGRATARRLPYNLRAAWDLPDSAPLLWVDGEKDVENARAAGICAVCGPDGGDTWQDDWAPLFLDHPAYIIPDKEPSGLAIATRVATGVEPFTPHVEIKALAAKDLTAWLETLRATTEGHSHAA